MPLATCKECGKKYYHNNAFVAASGRTQRGDLCTACELNHHDQPFGESPRDSYFKTGSEAVINYPGSTHDKYQIVTIREITALGTIIAGDRCFRGRLEVGGTRTLIPVTDKIREHCLKLTVQRDLETQLSLYRSRLNVDQLARILDVILEVRSEDLKRGPYDRNDH